MKVLKVVQYEKGDKITYPEGVLDTGLHEENYGLSLPDIYGDYIHYSNNGKFSDRGFNVHHVESLETSERFVRGLIEYHGITYVFSGRMRTQSVGALSYAALVEAAIAEIENLQAGKEIEKQDDDYVRVVETTETRKT